MTSLSKGISERIDDNGSFFCNYHTGNSKNTEPYLLQSTTGEGLWRINLKTLLNLEENYLLLLLLPVCSFIN
jgi:hypothetical protein